jgi:hypothetical protein
MIFSAAYDKSPLELQYNLSVLFTVWTTDEPEYNLAVTVPIAEFPFLLAALLAIFHTETLDAAVTVELVQVAIEPLYVKLP